ncbi:MAG TPA: hypothetical protein VGG85_08505 [Terracidiphilus sp.]|jgi:hypothetical protein
MGHIALHSEKGMKVNVKRGLPSIEAAGVGIKGVGAGAAVAKECVMVAQLRRGTAGKEKQNTGNKQEGQNNETRSRHRGHSPFGCTKVGMAKRDGI